MPGAKRRVNGPKGRHSSTRGLDQRHPLVAGHRQWAEKKSKKIKEA
jgi:hypothetical protein